MDDLVVTDGQQKTLTERVEEAEGDVVVMVGPPHRVLVHVLQRVVHPPHVPLQAEAEAAVGSGMGHATPGGRLLGDHDDSRVALVRRRVRLLKERDRLEILPPTEAVRDPLAVLARVIEIEHGCHGIHPESVDVEHLEPVARVRDQEVAHLRVAEVEHQCAPVRLFPEPRIGVFVQCLSVELRQRPLVFREVGGHPVHDDADSGLVEPVNQIPEVIGVSVPRRRRVVPGHLVTPRAAEGVFCDRQELDVRVCQLGKIVDELIGEFSVTQARTPGADVHLIHTHRGVVGIALRASSHPVRVAPFVERLADHGRRLRRYLGVASHRVSPLHPVAALGQQLELVGVPGLQPGDEQLPDSAGGESTHGVLHTVPVVEVADDARGLRMRCPDREACSDDVLVRTVVRAQHVPQLLVTSFAPQIEIHVADGRDEAIRVVSHPARRPFVAGFECVRLAGAGRETLPQSVGRVFERDARAILLHGSHGLGERSHRADHEAIDPGDRGRMLTKRVMRIRVPPLHQCQHVIGVEVWDAGPER